MNIKDEILKELNRIEYPAGISTNTVKLHSDLGIRIIENVVEKLLKDVEQINEYCECSTPELGSNISKCVKCGKLFSLIRY